MGAGAAPPEFAPASEPAFASAAVDAAVAAADGELPGRGGVLDAGAGLLVPLPLVAAVVAGLKPALLLILLLKRSD